MGYQKKIREIIIKFIQESVSQLKFKLRKCYSRAETICKVKVFYETLDWVATRKTDKWCKVRRLDKYFGNLNCSSYLHDSGFYIGLYPKKVNHRISNLAFVIDDFRGNF